MKQYSILLTENTLKTMLSILRLRSGSVIHTTVQKIKGADQMHISQSFCEICKHNDTDWQEVAQAKKEMGV